jgi:hypothetical protein
MTDTIRTTSGLAWAGVAIAVAALTLAVGNADSARNWSEGLRPGPVSQPVREAAERWAGFTKASRLSLVRDEVRGLWERRHEVGWTGRSGKHQVLAPPA